MRHLLQDVRFGLRTLLKTPGFTLVAVLVLALGIGANTAMFTLVNAMLFRPLAGKAGEMVGVYSHDRTKPDSYRAFSYPNFADIRANNDVFEGVMAHTFSMVGVPAGDTTRQTFVEVVSSNYFTTLGVTLAAGREFSADEEQPGARIPVAIVRNERGDLLGKTVRVNSIDFSVVGVAPHGFTGTMALVSPEIWLPLGMFDVVVTDLFKGSGASLADRANTPLVVAGRLKPGMTMARAGAQLEVMSRNMESAYPAENKNQLLTISPLPRMSTSTSPGTDSGLGVAAALLMALSGVVLLIACLNIANMLLARGAARRKEMAIRLAVGGGRGRIVAQLLTEGLLLAGAGAIAGLLLSYWATTALGQSLAAVMPMTIEFQSRPDALVLTVTTAFAVLATVLSGLGPALKMSRADLVSDLKDLAAAAQPTLGRRFTARNALVVGQIALSLMLLSAGGLFARGALKAAAANPGFSYDRQLLVGIDPALAQYGEARGRELRRAALERIRRIPGVEAAASANTVPFGDFHEGHPVERIGAAEGQRASGTYRIIGADYFLTLNLPMLRGREFSATEEESDAAPRVVIVDERLARRLFGADDPIGQTIRFVHQEGAMRQEDPTPMEIIGIAPPIRDELFHREPEPAVYVPFGRNYRSMTNIHVRAASGGTQAAVLDDIRRELRAVDARMPIVQATTMQAFHDRHPERQGRPRDGLAGRTHDHQHGLHHRVRGDGVRADRTRGGRSGTSAPSMAARQRDDRRSRRLERRPRRVAPHGSHDSNGRRARRCGIDLGLVRRRTLRNQRHAHAGVESVHATAFDRADRGTIGFVRCSARCTITGTIIPAPAGRPCCTRTRRQSNTKTLAATKPRRIASAGLFSFMPMDYSKLNGLVPAVIQDADTREVLMVGFMNQEALDRTMSSGFATFFSRTRGKLWTKGETSGNRLKVERVLVDCDDDTVLVTVTRQGDGNVCHTGERSCFYREYKAV